MQFFDVTIGIKIPFFRASVTIKPGRSLLQFVPTNCLINKYLEGIIIKENKTYCFYVSTLQTKFNITIISN